MEKKKESKFFIIASIIDNWASHYKIKFDVYERDNLTSRILKSCYEKSKEPQSEDRNKIITTGTDMYEWLKDCLTFFGLGPHSSDKMKITIGENYIKASYENEDIILKAKNEE